MTSPSMTPTEIARSLTGAQKKYINAVYDSGGDYEPRHGVTANWALRHGITDTVLHYPDGSKRLWNQDEVGFDEAYRIGGQSLTPLGLAVRAALERMNDEQ